MVYQVENKTVNKFCVNITTGSLGIWHTVSFLYRVSVYFYNDILCYGINRSKILYSKHILTTDKNNLKFSSSFDLLNFGVFEAFWKNLPS